MNEPQSTPVVAILCLPSVKSGGTFRVRGKSAKPYEFRMDRRHNMLVREYHSLELFYREEGDIRGNTANPFAITTLLGASNPVLQAKEAVDKLIGASQQVELSARTAALREIIATAQDALAKIEGPLVEVPAAMTLPAIAATPIQSTATSVNSDNSEDPTRRRAGLRTERWQDGNGVLVEPSKAPDGSLTKQVAAGGVHTQAELASAELSSLRIIAKELGLSLQQATGGAKSRAMLVGDILEAEQKPAKLLS